MGHGGGDNDANAGADRDDGDDGDDVDDGEEQVDEDGGDDEERDDDDDDDVNNGDDAYGVGGIHGGFDALGTHSRIDEHSGHAAGDDGHDHSEEIGRNREKQDDAVTGFKALGGQSSPKALHALHKLFVGQGVLFCNCFTIPNLGNHDGYAVGVLPSMLNGHIDNIAVCAGEISHGSSS